MSEEITEEMRRIATEEGMLPELIECWHCMDGAHAPYYGVAPHRHVGSGIIGSTEMLGRREWPVNFKPDWEGIPEIERSSYEGPLCGLWYCEKDCKHGGITVATEDEQRQREAWKAFFGEVRANYEKEQEKSMFEEKLFYRDPQGLLHEIKTVNGNVHQDNLNAAINEYKEKYGHGIPVQNMVHAEVRVKK